MFLRCVRNVSENSIELDVSLHIICVRGWLFTRQRASERSANAPKSYPKPSIRLSVIAPFIAHNFLNKNK